MKRAYFISMAIHDGSWVGHVPSRMVSGLNKREFNRAVNSMRDTMWQFYRENKVRVK